MPHLELPANYYHCFLGNGLDAVLVGPTGSMVPDKFGVDRGAWYKSDRYYPEDRLVMTAGRWPLDKPLEHAPGSGWYDVAPLGRTWYEVLVDGQPLPLEAIRQRFVPGEGTLYSEVDFGSARGTVTTFVHPRYSLLVVHCEFDRPVEVRAWMGPGVWFDDGWDTDPFFGVEVDPARTETRYDLGETRGLLALRLDPAPAAAGGLGRDCWQTVRAGHLTQYFGITDTRQGPLDSRSMDAAIAAGYEALRAEHLAFWRGHFDTSRLEIPDDQFQQFYTASQYHFKAMQNPVSGGLPVNNLRRTWSSHIFWDSYFVQRALLEANHRAEALEACRFFQRTQAAARQHARDEFGCDGLKWDWEVTHDGRKAYGALLHMKDQVHNNASYANEIWNYYRFTQDLGFLREFYPILEGLATFFLQNVVEETARGYETRPVVGVHESPIRVRNDGITVTGTIVILRRAAEAARLLSLESDFTRRCEAVAAGLTRVLDRLYNGRYFQASEDRDTINMSSIAPIYPMQVVPEHDPRALSTVGAYIGRYEERRRGDGRGAYAFPWSSGVLATVLARQGEADLAWSVLDGIRPTICSFGGMTEVMEAGQWNMQYFGTAEAACNTALHSLVLQARQDEVRLFPAVPHAWPWARFERLLAAGLTVSGEYAPGRMTGRVRNGTRQPLTRTIRLGDRSDEVSLDPGEEKAFAWPEPQRP